MNNQDVCNYLIQNVKPHVNSAGNVYVADTMVREGYGQTCGGYFDEVPKSAIIPHEAEPSQWFHFITFYSNSKRNTKAPSYSSLHCPQLILWIAEVVGIDRDKLQSARRVVIEYEKPNNLKGDKNKGGSYLPKDIEIEFKEALEIYNVNTIIKDACNWKEVLAKVSDL